VGPTATQPLGPVGFESSTQGGETVANAALDDSARRVRLADAYAHWIPIARARLHEIQQLWNAVNHASWHKKGPDLLQDRPKLFQVGPLLRDIEIAASNVILFEHDNDLRSRVQSLIKDLPPLPDGIGGRHHPAVIAMNVAIHQKKLDLDQLTVDIAEHLGRPKVQSKRIAIAADSAATNK